MAAWTPEESEQLTALHAQGRSLHSIAGEMKRSKDTIRRHAERLGLSWDRTQTAKAAQAQHLDNKARRVQIEERLLQVVNDELDALNAEGRVYSFGGAMNEYREAWLERPPPHDRKAIVQTASTALNAANKLHEINAGAKATEAVSALVQMQESLQQYAAEYEVDLTEGTETTEGE